MGCVIQAGLVFFSETQKYFLRFKTTSILCVNFITIFYILQEILDFFSYFFHTIHYLVTEYGKVCLKGLSTWEKAEAIISVAHPDFRDQLIADAEKIKLFPPLER